jgi:preprotein translocase subunit Sec61beta
MPGLQSPRQSAGVMSFYDAPTKGPKLEPRLVLLAVILFALVVVVVDHFLV